jgi:hypothetical protein
MRHRQKTVAEDDWHGEFGNYDEWARLGSQPTYRSATFVDALKADVAALSKILLGHGTIGDFQ